MGLDMYLDKRIYISEFSHDNDNDNDNVESKIDKILDILKIKDESGNFKHIIVSVPAIYWRKSNHIHAWFVENIQDGVDDCREYYVSVEDLKRLLSAINIQLAEKEKMYPVITLSPQDGFFFGSTDIDEWYWKDLEYTKKSLEREILQAEIGGYSFTYHASW